MESLGQYALRLIIGALICGILLNLVPDGSYDKLLRLICGLFLTVVLLSPVMNACWEPDLKFFQDALTEGHRQVAAGEAMAHQERIRIISQQLEAYILDKAGQKGADLHVAVTLNEDGLPVEVELRGEISDRAKQELAEIIAEELGISKENQLWTG